MPPVVAAAAAWAGTATGAFVIKAAFTTGSIIYTRSQNAKLRRAMNNAGLDQGRSVMVRDPIAPRRLIYGEVLTSGTIVYIQTSGTKNEFLHLVVALAGHECDAIGDIYFNDEIVPLDGSGNATGKYAGFARVKKYLGLAAGERDLDLESESGGAWTSAYLGKSVARVHVRLKWSTELFPNGLPTIRGKVKGKKVYDPRTGLTVYSANSALCTADYLMDETFGKGIPLARIKIPALIEAANICDESIVLA